MAKSRGRLLYAQSSDIKLRTYLEYRKDMKRKAIAELEVLDWLERKLGDLYPDGKEIRVYKAGSDDFLWFLRKGGISRDPDFLAKIDNLEIAFEFQYAEKTGLSFYDFKVSKVCKKKRGELEPIENKYFLYIHKPMLKYAILDSEWIYRHGKLGIVEAWRSYAYRVPKEDFEPLLISDKSLEPVCHNIDVKNFILDFQHKLVDINRERLSNLLEAVIDEGKVVQISPNTLDDFFKVCFIFDNIGKKPKNVTSWLKHVLTYIKEDTPLEDISKIVYCIDFLYHITTDDLSENEVDILVEGVRRLVDFLRGYYREDGSYRSSKEMSPLEETRCALFSINLLEDLTQDVIHYYSVSGLKPIRKIFDSIDDVDRTYRFITGDSLVR